MSRPCRPRNHQSDLEIARRTYGRMHRHKGSGRRFHRMRMHARMKDANAQFWRNRLLRLSLNG